MNHTNLGDRIYRSVGVGHAIHVEGSGTTKPLPMPPMPDEVIAVSPTGDIAVVARTAADRAYGCVNFGPWVELGPTAQPVCVAWIDGRFVFARVADHGSRLYEQDADGNIIRALAVNTSQGILYFNSRTKTWVIKSNSDVTTVAGKTGLIKAVERDGWFFGQMTNPDCTAIVRPDGSIYARFKENYEHPIFTVAGNALLINEGRAFDKRFPPLPEDINAPPQAPKPQPPKPTQPPKEETVDPRIDLLEKWRKYYGHLPAGKERGFRITNGYAWDRRHEGFGLLNKKSPTASTVSLQGKHFPADIVVRNGVHYDVLQDGDGEAKPTFREVGPVPSQWEWVAPFDPQIFEPAPVPPPVEPVPPAEPTVPTFPPPVPPANNERLVTISIQLAQIEDLLKRIVQQNDVRNEAVIGLINLLK